MSSQEVEFRRSDFVSLWVGSFTSVEEAEAYFGIPDEIGVYLPPEGFTKDLGVDVPPECLEANFEQPLPRPLLALLKDASFSESFVDEAIEAASKQGIHEAQGIALLYDFDYQAHPGWKSAVGPLRFIGTFAFKHKSRPGDRQPVHDRRIQERGVMDSIL
jgi:hypothetical protein